MERTTMSRGDERHRCMAVCNVIRSSPGDKVVMSAYSSSAAKLDKLQRIAGDNGMLHLRCR